MSKQRSTLLEFAQAHHQILRSDRDCVIGVAGFTGEGKSTFAIKLAKAYSEWSGMPWDFKNLTWEREELLKWIDGKGKNKEGQKPEYSVVVPDELISMFYRRNWYEDDQKAAVELFNKCRDRHLLMIGNVPKFWDLDGGFTSRIRFYIYLPKRGVAWVFEQENNPFSTDPWNVAENRKIFRKKKTPYTCPNFVCEIEFPDFTPEEKKAYYAIRNEKRLGTENQNKGERIERYKNIKTSRDKLIRLILGEPAEELKKLTKKDIADITDLSATMIGMIERGER